jgi:hypothetical protein
MWVTDHSRFYCFTCQGLHSRPPTVVSPNEEAVRPPAEEVNSQKRGSHQETKTREHDPLADQDILESIEPEFFDSDGFDPCSHELKVNMHVFKMNLSFCCKGDIIHCFQYLSVLNLMVSVFLPILELFGLTDGLKWLLFFMWFIQKLPVKLECDAIERDCQKLQQQQLVVSKKVLQLILQKHTIFSEEFARLGQGHYRLHNRSHISYVTITAE